MTNTKKTHVQGGIPIVAENLVFVFVCVPPKFMMGIPALASAFLFFAFFSTMFLLSLRGVQGPGPLRQRREEGGGSRWPGPLRQRTEERGRRREEGRGRTREDEGGGGLRD